MENHNDKISQLSPDSKNVSKAQNICNPETIYLLIDERYKAVAFRLQRLLVADYFALPAQTNTYTAKYYQFIVNNSYIVLVDVTQQLNKANSAVNKAN